VGIYEKGNFFPAAAAFMRFYAAGSKLLWPKWKNQFELQLWLQDTHMSRSRKPLNPRS